MSELFQGIRNGNVSFLARAITLVESSLPQDRLLANELINLVLPFSGSSFRLGITGVPGVGKSSFIESFGKLLLANGKKIAVLAVDPSSEKSKGSILGDKTRMETLSASPHVFIRPTASGGHLGGIARNTFETILLCEAAGYDFIIVETVGVGQSETAVQHLTDFFLLLMLAGSGDELQGIKRGIMELADAILITKADGKNIEPSKVAKAEFSRALHYLPASESGWIPFTEICSSNTGLGLDNFLEKLNYYETQQKLGGYFKFKRESQSLHWFDDELQSELNRILLGNPMISGLIEGYKKEIISGNISPHAASATIVSKVLTLLNI